MDANEKKALRYANVLRKRLGLEPVDHLEKGVFNNPCRCPIANTVRLGAAEKDWVSIGLTQTLLWSANVPSFRDRPTPKYARGFIEDFDLGRYPLLVDTPSAMAVQ